MAYSPAVIEHYSHPRNVGRLDKNDPNVGEGIVGAPECGDLIRLSIRINPQTEVIEDVRWKTFGCGSAVASSSYISELAKGKSVEKALEIKNTEVREALSLPPAKIHCSILARDAIEAAIKDWKEKQNGHQ